MSNRQEETGVCAIAVYRVNSECATVVRIIHSSMSTSAAGEFVPLPQDQ
ncbi:MAG: hypothetical protein HKN37_03780 [Rhodothermales bacterium]|nr:hypothetical protein [Rhodothermales bacterium]